jgi:hypothetical protein
MLRSRDERCHAACVEKDNAVDVAELETPQVSDSAILTCDARPRVARKWAEDRDFPDVDRVGVFFRDHAAANHGGAPAETVLPAVERPRGGVVSKLGTPGLATPRRRRAKVCMHPASSEDKQRIARTDAADRIGTCVSELAHLPRNARPRLPERRANKEQTPNVHVERIAERALADAAVGLRRQRRSLRSRVVAMRAPTEPVLTPRSRHARPAAPRGNRELWRRRRRRDRWDHG